MTFQNAAGFLRVIGEEPLDRTIVHPEQYAVTRELLQTLMGSAKKLSSAEISALLFSDRLVAAVRNCTWSTIQASASGGAQSVETLQTIAKWVSDDTYSSTATSDVRGIRGVAPRLHRRGLPRPEDLTVGAVVEGTVRNITSFGVFVDIGAGDDALLHKSQYGEKERVGFVIGEQLPAVTILSVSSERGGKISLTLKSTRASHGVVQGQSTSKFSSSSSGDNSSTSGDAKATNIGTAYVPGSSSSGTKRITQEKSSRSGDDGIEAGDDEKKHSKKKKKKTEINDHTKKKRRVE